jgi:cellobiose transport system permease protein
MHGWDPASATYACPFGRTKKLMGVQRRLARRGYLFILPYFLLFTLFSGLPMLFSIYLSLTKWDGIGSPKYIALKNFIRLVSVNASFFYKSLSSIFTLLLLYLPLLLVLSLVLAAFLNSKSIRRKSPFQLSIFIPFVTTPIAVGLLFSLLFDRTNGTINNALLALGFIRNGINWLHEPLTARIVVCIMIVWKYLGYAITFYLAGMANIPEERYEAADIDGASAMQKFFYVTIPHLRPVVTFLIITGIIGGLQLFDEPKLLFTGLTYASDGELGGPQKSVLTPIWYLYSLAFRNLDYGFGASVGVGLFVIIMVIALSTFRVMNRGGTQDE